MSNIFTKIIPILTLTNVAVASNSSVFNIDIMSSSCSKNFNQYYGCNFFHYLNTSLTNTKNFTLIMEFKLEYSRGSCGSQFINGRYREGNFKLKLATDLESRPFFSGNIRTKLQGNRIYLQDEDPWITQSAEFSQPCRLILRNMEIDFSESAKEEIASIVNRKKTSSLIAQQKELIVQKIIQIQNAIPTAHFKFAAENLRKIIEDFKMLNDQKLLTAKQKTILKSTLKKLDELQYSDSHKLSEFIINSFNHTLEKVKQKLSENFYSSEYKQQYNHDIQLNSILHEIENEPYFNKKSLSQFKKLMIN